MRVFLENTPKSISSDEDSDENAAELEKYVHKLAPSAAALITRDGYKRFFSRRIFSGAVTKVSKIGAAYWAALIGDAAHSPIPATGEGINSALEDCSVLQDCLGSGKKY
jgi:kynurenine 3-monooxygenase